MADGEQNILLRLVGDNDDAKRALQEMARELEQFDRQKAEAAADVETEGAKAKIKLLARELAAIGDEQIRVDIDTGASAGLIGKLKAQLASIGDEQVEVNVDRDGKGAKSLATLGERVKVSQGGWKDLASGIRATSTNLTAMLIPALIGAIGSIAPAVTVLASAALALGALGVAAAGAGVALGVFAAVGVARFKKQADEAGTAAHRLKVDASDLVGVLHRAAATGVDRVFSSLGLIMRNLHPEVAGLRGAFTTLGTGIAGSLRANLSSIQGLVRGFGQLATASAPLVGALIGSLMSLGRIFINIATAAMPLLVDGARKAAGALSSFAESTDDVGAVRKVIAGLVPSLKLVWELGLAVGRALIPVFTALRAAGPVVVKDLTALANQFGRWAATAEGQRRIAEFFSQTFFSVRDLGKALAAAAPLVAGFMQSFGGVQTIILRGVTKLLEALETLPPGLQGAAIGISGIGAAAVQLGPGLLMMAKLRNIEAALTGATNASTLAMVRQKVATLASAAATKVVMVATKVAAAAQWLWNAALAANPIGLIVLAIVALVAGLVLAYTKIGWFRDLVNGAFNAIKTVVAAVIPVVVGYFRLWWSVVSTVARGIIAAVSAIAGGVGAAVSAVAGAISAIVGAVTGAVSAVFNAAKALGNAIASGIAAVAGAIAAAARKIFETVVTIIRGYVGAYRAAGTAVFNAVRNGIAAVAGAIRSAVHSILRAVVEIVRSYVGAATNAGRAVFNAVRSGIAAAAAAIRDVARSIIARAVEIVRSFIDNAANAGEAVFNAVRRGIASVAGAIREVASKAVDGALDVVKGLATAFFNAGKALISAAARGVAAGAGEIIGAAKDIANKVKDILPGSEPKDPTSPFRRLDLAGRAIVENVAAGMRAAAPALGAELAASVGGLTATLNAQVAAPVVSPAGMTARPALQPSGPVHHHHFTQVNQMLHPDDPKVLRTLARATAKGWRNEPHRPASRERIG